MSAGPHPGSAAASAAGDAPKRERFKDRARDFAHRALAPLVELLHRAAVKPDHLTVLGLALSLGSGLAFFEGNFPLGSLLLALAGLCDILDGEVARRRGTTSRFGAFFDSTLDRIADAAVLCGIAGYYVMHLVELSINPSQAVAEVSRGLEPVVWARVAMLAMFGMVGSLVVSYARARAEGLGLECKVGWFERPERTVLLIVAGLFGVGPVMAGALILLALFSFVTAMQRVTHVWKITRGAGMDT